MGKCVIAGRECPKTNDQTEKRFCPHWVVDLPQNEPDGSGRFMQSSFTGCFLVNHAGYMLSIAATASHAAASYDSARNVLIKIKSDPAIRAVLEMGLTVAAGSIQTSRGTPPDSQPQDQIEQEADSG